MDYHHVLVSGKEEQIRSGALFEDVAIDILKEGNYLRFRAHGNSMAPLIRNDDIVIVQPKASDKLRLGSIVFYRRGMGRYIVHRLINRTRDNGSLILKTKGDNLKCTDTPVFAEQILGEVVRIEARGKELCLDTILGRVINFLMIYSNIYSIYTKNIMRRVIVKAWWLASAKSLSYMRTVG